MKRFDVVIRGAGAVGSCLALALSRQGLAVALQGADGATRAAAAQREDVRAYALNAGSVQLLRELKVWDALPADARCAVYDMHVEGDALGSALDFSAWTQGVEALAWIVDTAELERVLAAAVSFAPHVQCVAEGQAQAPLLALAEGKASSTREQLGVAMPVQRYGHSAVAARLCSDIAHAGTARQWFRSPDVLALLPFDRPEPARSWALVWSVPQSRADELLALPGDAFEHALADATGGAAGTLRLASERAAWPLSLARAEQVSGPGWVLLGDAAHVVHPLAGQGLNLGLADVRALAQVIAQREAWRELGDERLLQRYARQRALPTLAMGQLTDGLLHLFASEQPMLRELRNRGLSLVNGLPPLKRLLTALALDA
ncbi:MAG TPA: FAD-dependent monooxygenase [Rubrivivax sp.]|nr:FAD-dependent monooxygenase [Rubrivivax sp.]HPO19474.1 FAD-dependent monooxygenase [Rubrivivax sp.]